MAGQVPHNGINKTLTAKAVHGRIAVALDANMPHSGVDNAL